MSWLFAVVTVGAACQSTRNLDSENIYFHVQFQPKEKRIIKQEWAEIPMGTLGSRQETPAKARAD